MRNLTALLVLVGIFWLGGSSLAAEVSMQNHTAEEIKSVCDKVGGRFSQDAGGIRMRHELPRRARHRLQRPKTLLNALQAQAR